MNRNLFIILAGPARLLLLLSALISTLVQATPSDPITEVQARAAETSLWLNPEWLNLVHYEKEDDENYLSQVDDASFFNAPEGKASPRAEMMATIAALFRTDIQGDQHAQCRFLARFNWLKHHLVIDDANLPAVECAEYKQWRSHIPDHQVTLVFPAYHLNSPSSMFGHTLLRLDPKPEAMGSDWLSIAVNFGANVRAEDNSLFFAFKGLSGGYPGFFIVTPYFEKIKEYNRNEKRDIWEYKLDLSPQETRNMIMHLWELKNTAFDYYFFDENCSYRLLELLEVARPGIDLTSEFKLTAIPVDTVRAVENAGMIISVDYRPSQVTVLEALLAPLNEQQQVMALKLSSDISILDNDAFISLNAQQQKDVVEIAYKYLRYRETNNERVPDAARQSFLLLKALNSYPSSETRMVEQTALPPETGHYSKRMSVTTGREGDLNFAEIAARFSFHSLEDNRQGFLPGAQINLGSMQLRATEHEQLKVQQLDVVDIFSLTPRTRFFKPMSWRVYTGLERQMTDGRDRLVSHVTGGMGYTYQPFGDNFSYMMLNFRLEHNPGFDNSLEPGAGLVLGSLQHFAGATARVELSGERFSNDEYRMRALYRHNFTLSRNHSLMFSAQREYQPNDVAFNELSLSYHYFFR